MGGELCLKGSEKLGRGEREGLFCEGYDVLFSLGEGRKGDGREG